MPIAAEKQKSVLRRWFALCPVRHTLTLVSFAVIGAYFALRGSFTLMTWMSAHVVRPWHRFFGKLFNDLPFSVAGVLIAAFVLGCLAYIVYSIVQAVRCGGVARRAYLLFITAVSLTALIYALFCLLWGVYYYTSDFEAQSGVHAVPVSVERLESVTRYFAQLADSYGAQVDRDENGLYAAGLDEIFERSAMLYDEVEKSFPCLTGDGLLAKPFLFSKGMSLVNFTGFFFPFTGEANINVDSPACMVPSTIAHELAHQRGVAAEDEANFVAVLACLENGDADYCYSASLLAYIHLSNALYKADTERWRPISEGLSPGVRADIVGNNAYWQRYKTAVSKTTDAVYTGFLHSYGQTLGLQTYGACVDLLVAYYYKGSIAD